MSVNADAAPPAIASFIRNFYRLSDDPNTHEEYADSLNHATTTTFQIGPMSPATTRQDVLDWRSKAWESIASRKHTVYDVFTTPKNEKGGAEYMLHGRVDYEKKDGSKAGASWAGLMKFETTTLESNPKLSSYNVWLTAE